MASKNENSIEANLKVIREVIDSDHTDIEMVKDKVIQLSSLAGLAAECQAGAKKRYENAKLKKLSELKDSGLQASVLLKTIDLECYAEAALYEYSQRISAGISHSLDALRSIISLYKTEINNSL